MKSLFKRFFGDKKAMRTEFSRFFSDATQEEKKKLYEQVAKEANADQRALVERYRRLSTPKA